uniref:Isoform 2 of splicing factor u2af small subunit a n=1 Tax=Quercus ilex TaxID=58334 RepID=A0A2V0UNH3_QUEIL
MMTEISVPSMIGAGGREAAVLDVEGNEAEALEEGGIGVLSGKVVLKEGLRLSNGIGKGNRQNLVFRTMRITLTMTAMALNRMISIMSLSNISSMIDTTISPIRLVWFGCHCLWSIVCRT